MKTIREIFACWDSLTEMAEDIGEGHWAVSKWKQRRKIPSSAWPALMSALKRKGKNVGAAELLAMHMKSKRSPINQPNNRGNAA